MKKKILLLSVIIVSGGLLAACTHTQNTPNSSELINNSDNNLVNEAENTNTNSENVNINTDSETREPETSDEPVVTPPKSDPQPEPEKPVENTDIPNRLNYTVPFTSQAPYGNWDELHGEACEEASMIMVDAYFNKLTLNKQNAEQKILNMVEWQANNGYKVDLNAQEMKDILAEYYDLRADIISEITVDRMKAELAAGKLIIIPVAGREIGNPNFRNPGPIYHVLVIKGYDETNFITNDPGTRNGADYKYRYQVLIDAMHEWPHELADGGMTDEEIAQGKKVFLSVYK